MSADDITVAMPRAFVEDVRSTIEKMDEYRAIPDADFPGHKGIALANLEGYLGGRLESLFRARVADD